MKQTADSRKKTADSRQQTADSRRQTADGSTLKGVWAVLGEPSLSGENSTGLKPPPPPSPTCVAES
jgi:hypothetical protein